MHNTPITVPNLAFFFIILLFSSEFAEAQTDNSPQLLDSSEIQLFLGLPSDSSSEIRGNCYSVNNFAQPYYYWRTPHPFYGDTAWAQKFYAEKPETLLAVQMLIFDANDGKFGNDDIYITIYDDDGNGLPGLELGRSFATAGTYSAYPSLATVYFTGLTVVVSGFYHVAFSTSAEIGVDYENLISTSEFEGSGLSSGSGSPLHTGWYSMAIWWGYDVNFLFVVSVCGDEYVNCNANRCYTAISRRWAVPNADGTATFAQKNPFNADSCRIDKIGVRFGWPNSEEDLPLYTYPTKVHIYHDSSGFPGTKIATKTIEVADYASAGLIHPTGTKTIFVDFAPLQIFVEGEYWVGVESLAPDSLSGVRILSDNGDGGCTGGFAVFDGNWQLVADEFAVPINTAMVVSFGYCCKPPSLLEVPDHYGTIQTAINASRRGDTVLVHPGIYHENINFASKRIIVASKFLTTGDTSFISNTILDGNQHQPTVSFVNYENDSSKLIGLTVTHQTGLTGPGIQCTFSSPIIKNNRIINNVGHGLAAFSASPTIENNTIEGNYASHGGGLFLTGQNSPVISNIIRKNRALSGGGMYTDEVSFVFRDNIVSDNSADTAAALFLQRADIDLLNCVIANNLSNTAGIVHLSSAQVNFINCIIAFNFSPGTTVSCNNSLSHYSFNCCNSFQNSGGDSLVCTQPVDLVENSFHENPLFCNAPFGDFQLNILSPCLPQNSPCGSLVGTFSAGCNYVCGDADGNGTLGLEDIVFLNHYYYECDSLPAYYGAGDANCDGVIDLRDILFLAMYLNSNAHPPCCP